MSPDFADVISQNLRFVFETGGITVMQHPHTTGWRTLNCLMTAQILDGEHAVRFGAGGAHRVHHGDTICVVPELSHLSNKVSRTPSVSRWSHTRFTLFDTMDLFDLIEMPPILTGDTAQQIGALNTALASASPMGRGTLADAVWRRGIGLLLSAVLLEAAILRPQGLAFQHHAERLTPALRFIEGNLAQPFNQGELAALVHLSPSRFRTVFREAFRMSPDSYIRNQRLCRARELLLSTNASIAEVATRSGYADPFHFSRAFRNRFGTSPTLYRQHVATWK